MKLVEAFWRPQNLPTNSDMSIQPIKPVVTVESPEKWKSQPNPQATGLCAQSLMSKTSPIGSGDEGIVWPCLTISAGSCTTSTPIHSVAQGRLCCRVEIQVEAAIYPPNCSVILLISLFKSLSVLRCSSIFSTECKTVVWCFPPNCRPISGSDASVRCLARYMAIWRG